MDKVEFYRDSYGWWRWRYIRSNGRIMANSGEGYNNKADAKSAAEHLFRSIDSDTQFTWKVE